MVFESDFSSEELRTCCGESGDSGEDDEGGEVWDEDVEVVGLEVVVDCDCGCGAGNVNCVSCG